MTYENWVRLGEVLRAIDERKDVKVTVITGAGSFFSSGADVKNRGGDANVGKPDEAPRLASLRRFASMNADLARTFYVRSA
jgi:peroxisomal 3,2-trans-enoyl-CoA isomerase